MKNEKGFNKRFDLAVERMSKDIDRGYAILRTERKHNEEK